MQIVRTLLAEEEGGRACGTFGLPVSKSTASHHFKVLRLAGVIVYEVTEAEAAAPAVEAAARIAFNGGLMVAVLLSQRMLGAKLFKD